MEIGFAKHTIIINDVIDDDIRITLSRAHTMPYWYLSHTQLHNYYVCIEYTEHTHISIRRMRSIRFNNRFHVLAIMVSICISKCLNKYYSMNVKCSLSVPSLYSVWWSNEWRQRWSWFFHADVACFCCLQTPMHHFEHRLLRQLHNFMCQYGICSAPLFCYVTLCYV